MPSPKGGGGLALPGLPPHHERGAPDGGAPPGGSPTATQTARELALGRERQEAVSKLNLKMENKIDVETALVEDVNILEEVLTMFCPLDLSEADLLEMRRQHEAERAPSKAARVEWYSKEFLGVHFADNLACGHRGISAVRWRRPKVLEKFP